MSIFEGINNRFYADMQEELYSIETAVLNGNISDFSEYKRLIGKRSGLLQALDRHKELIYLMEKDRD